MKGSVTLFYCPPISEIHLGLGGQGSVIDASPIDLQATAQSDSEVIYTPSSVDIFTVLSNPICLIIWHDG